MTNVFISWSGPKSHQIANTMHRWLPVVLQSIKPFISSEDLRKGGRWVAELSKELESGNFGIICLTPSNLTAPWILFESGALSKSVGDSQVVPFLVGVKPSDLPAPLTQFNAAKSDKDDFIKMVRAINARAGSDAVAEDLIDRSANACWPQIQAELADALEPADQPTTVEEPSQDGIEKFDAILQELLVLNRAQSKILTTPEELLPLNYVSRALTRRGDIPGRDHRVWSDLSDVASKLRELPDNYSMDKLFTLSRKLDDIVTFIQMRRGTELRYGSSFIRRRTVDGPLSEALPDVSPSPDPHDQG